MMSSFLTETEIHVLKTNQRGRYIQNPTVQQEIEKKKDCIWSLQVEIHHHQTAIDNSLFSPTTRIIIC